MSREDHQVSVQLLITDPAQPYQFAMMLPLDIHYNSDGQEFTATCLYVQKPFDRPASEKRITGHSFKSEEESILNALLLCIKEEQQRQE